MPNSTKPTASSPTTRALPPTFSPDTLDALTSLAHELARVRAGTLQGTTDQAGGNNNNNNNNGGAAGAGAGATASGGAGTGAGAGAGAGGDPKAPLAIKDVPGVTDAIKHKVQRARAAVVGLPDMTRGIEEQEREIGELRGRIERQRGVLRALREKGERGEGMEM